MHLVGRFSQPVAHLLVPMTDALHKAGFEQAVVLLEDPASPSLAESIHPEVKLVLLPWGSGPLRRWRSWLRAVRLLLEEAPAEVVHVHGFIPAALSGTLLSVATTSRLVYSPHDSRLHQTGTVAQRMAGAMARPFLRGVAHAAVVTMPSEARVLHRLRGVPVAQVDAPVDPAYFAVRRHPALHPLVVGGAADASEAVAASFAQAAVLMANGERGLAFHWIGTAESAVREQFRAAKVVVVDSPDPSARCADLAAAWVYVCPQPSRGFPVHLVEAMAAGLPVVAIDAAKHRDLIRDRETGFLCRDELQLIERVSQLLHDPALRATMGASARNETLRRFGGHTFDAAIASIYAA